MGNAQRDIRGHFAMKPYRTRIAIRFIDDAKSLKDNREGSSVKVYGSTIDGSFHTVRTFPNVMMLISMSKSARASVRSNTSSNMSSREVIGQPQFYKVMSTKFKISLTHVIFQPPKQPGVFLVSSCITSLQRSNVSKFTFSISRPSHSIMIQISSRSYTMTVLARLP